MFNKLDYVMVTGSDMNRSIEFYRVCIDPDGMAISFAESVRK